MRFIFQKNRNRLITTKMSAGVTRNKYEREKFPFLDKRLRISAYSLFMFNDNRTGLSFGMREVSAPPCTNY